MIVQLFDDYENSSEQPTDYVFTTPEKARQFIEDYDKDTTDKWNVTIKELHLDPVFKDQKVIWVARVASDGELIQIYHRDVFKDDKDREVIVDEHYGKTVTAISYNREVAIDLVRKAYEIYKQCQVIKPSTMTWFDHKKFDSMIKTIKSE